MDSFIIKAAEMAKDFLENSKDYRMGFVEAEQSNPKTRNLDKIFKECPADGVRTLFSVDADLTELYRSALASESFDRFCEKIKETLMGGGRIILSGCGSSGRLCMGAERAFRRAAKRYQRPEFGKQITTIMTGGDYAVIRAVEFFEDYQSLSAKQVDELEVGKGDLIIGVTATAETTSVLGTAQRAAERGAFVYMIVCSDPQKLMGRMERVDKLYGRDDVAVVYLPCGAMAVTGSTRMQSSSIEQAIIMSAFEIVLAQMCGEDVSKQYLCDGFENMISNITADACVKAIADYAVCESELYKNGGYVTYFTENFMLDILTDSTERPPTFAMPPIRQQCRKDLELSWAFAKNPSLSTHEAWEDCFGRAPRCIEWTEEVYRSLGVNEKIPDISFDRLSEFEIGCECDIEREEKADTIAVWLDTKPATECFEKCAVPYKRKFELVFNPSGCETMLEIFEHIGMKMILNAISTSTAALFGRISGNYMTFLDMSNKKLIDRGSRIISELCGVKYETALEELLYQYLKVKASGENASPAQKAIQKLGVKGE